MKYNDLYQVTPLLEHARYCHDDYELIFVSGASGTRLIIGDHMIVLHEDRLLLLAPYIPFALERTDGRSERPMGTAVRFPAELLSNKLLGKNQLVQVSGLLERSAYGVLFAGESAGYMGARVVGLGATAGFGAFLQLLSLLHDLAVLPGWVTVSEKAFSRQVVAAEEEYCRIETAFAFMRANFTKPISLADVAGKARMTRGAFCRFIRRRTGKTYVESINEMRIRHICTMLLESTESIAEIAYKAGYNNIHYFHRWFKRQEGCTPKEFRQRSLEMPEGV